MVALREWSSFLRIIQDWNLGGVPEKPQNGEFQELPYRSIFQMADRVKIFNLESGNRHKRRHRAPRGANGAGPWRQLALGGGANWRWAVAPIAIWRQLLYGANWLCAMAPIGC